MGKLKKILLKRRIKLPEVKVCGAESAPVDLAKNLIFQAGFVRF